MFLKLVCFLQLPASNIDVQPQPLFVTTGQPHHAAKIRGRGAARVLVTSMVHYMKLMVRIISVCHGTDHIYIHYRAKYRTVLG